MDDEDAFGETVARKFLKVTAVLLAVAAFGLYIVPGAIILVVISNLLPTTLGRVLAFVGFMGWTFFLWWMSRFQRVKRAINAFEHLMETCWL